MTTNNAEALRKALRRAFVLGETHAYQSDSDSASQNRKADETLATFRAHVEQAVAALASQPPADAVADAKDAARYRWLRARFDVSTVEHFAQFPDESDPEFDPEVDAAIDAALHASQKEAT